MLTHSSSSSYGRAGSRGGLGLTFRRSVRRIAMAASSDPRIEEMDDDVDEL